MLSFMDGAYPYMLCLLIVGMVLDSVRWYRT